MANSVFRVKVKKTFTYDRRVVVPEEYLTVDAKTAQNLSERNLVVVVDEEIVEDEQVVDEEIVEDEHTDELDGMLVDELKEYAAEAGIDLEGKTRKADIIAVIRKAM